MVRTAVPARKKPRRRTLDRSSRSPRIQLSQAASNLVGSPQEVTQDTGGASPVTINGPGLGDSRQRYASVRGVPSWELPPDPDPADHPCWGCRDEHRLLWRGVATKDGTRCERVMPASARTTGPGNPFPFWRRVLCRGAHFRVLLTASESASAPFGAIEGSIGCLNGPGGALMLRPLGTQVY
ncbi:hypothetical protein NDU88_005477 [Pleurodeles waltl]|uniref:Uncharacterized protein n=1 Tax=Pleurodeles waltl TaxID=8319 RepID=A0AAV7VMR8_PLEWA|nr:hypothetical protein NDU88_005477 [Pleurodeles waltl]